jgi:ATP-dependent helicase HrpA
MAGTRRIRKAFTAGQVERRRALVPAVRYPEDLPVVGRRDDLLAAIRQHQVVIVAGETGSGKSTQLPKLCLELGRGVAGMIGHTQPRRLAARTVAERLCVELGVALGGPVGYTVRFADTVGDDTLVRVMTDGILLMELQHDRLLRRYDTIIVDEAHERTLNIDFILGYLKQILPRRPDLKVIVTSATIDTERIAHHFDDAPIIEVTGRTYPVEVRYRPAEGGSDDQVQAICDAVSELASEGPGDILVFLSGERDIRDAADGLAGTVPEGTELLPLFARLTVAEQHRVFHAHKGSRIVLATNVAETSLTVPGIRYVVDPGTARISRYSQRTNVQRLPIEPVSQASANQRAGRCGREAPGVCIRLYSEEDYLDRPEFTDPEILRTNLAAVLLRMAALGLGDVEAFPFVDAPDARRIRDGAAELEELGALDARGGLTPVGRALAQMPIDVRLGRMVIEADRNGCLREVMTIAAALSIQDPRERPADERQAADEAHGRFAHPDSDLLGWLDLWSYVRRQQKALSGNQFRRLCRAEYLNHQRVREWQDVYAQLQEVTRSLGMRPRGGDAASPEQIHRSILAGLLSHAGVRDERTDRRPVRYLGARQARFAIWPGSALARRPPRWVMAAELVETGQLWAREVAGIDPDWLEQLGAHLLKRTYGEPWWDARRAGGFLPERVTLFGLPIVTDRPVPYARVDPDAAKAMFVRHALVEGDWGAAHRFLAHNASVRERVRDLEDRVRRRGLLIDDAALEAWYARRLPEHVTSGRSFDRWWKAERGRRPELLDMRVEDVIDPAASSFERTAYPDAWQQDDLSLPLTYRFDPGAADDGVSVAIPLGALGAVRPDGFDWQIPGYRAELVAALMRTLPKDLRRRIGSPSEAAKEFLERFGPAHGPLVPLLAHHLSQVTGERVAPAALRLDRVPGYLQMTFRAVAAGGRTLAASQRLRPLQDRLGTHVQAVLARAAPLSPRSGERTWSFGAFPQSIDVEIEGLKVRAYPGLVDEGQSVGLRVFADPAERDVSTWAGCRRLLLLAAAPERRHLQRILAAETRQALARTGYAPVERVLDECTACAADELLAEQGGPVWDDDGFARLTGAGQAGLQPLTVEVATQAGRVLALEADVRARLDRLPAATASDLERQLARLVYPGFLLATGYRRLPDLVRYMEAAAWRASRAAAHRARDAELQEVIASLDAELSAAHAEPAAAQEIRWMIEELRVSLFAQHLGTSTRVSESRVRRAIAALSPG